MRGAQVLKDFLDFIRGNIKTKVKDPVFGTFLISWIVSNWDKFFLLFFGQGIFDDRVTAFQSKFSWINSWSQFDYHIFLTPLGMTLFYLFAMPYVSSWVVKYTRKKANKNHSQAIEVEMDKAESQKALSKINLTGNPEKEFLGQELQIDLNERKLKITQEEENIKQKTKEKDRLYHEGNGVLLDHKSMSQSNVRKTISAF